MKITIWLARWDRPTWIASAEILGLAWVVLTGPGTFIRLLVGVPLLAHLGYTAVTGLPIGMIPGRPSDKAPHRRNLDLRSTIVVFLNEVRRVESFAQRAKDSGMPRHEVEESLRAAHERIMAAAAQVVSMTGRSTSEPGEGTYPTTDAGSTRILTHARPVHGAVDAL